jgi:hypothetical protein
MMKIPKYLLLALTLLLINLETLNAATILGKVAIYTSASGTQTYPLVSGNKMYYGNKALIKITGGTLIADEGTIFEALDKGEQIAFQVEKGSIYFRILPNKIRVSFKTPQGEVSTPKAVPASNSTITGRIMVNDKGTILEVNEGTLEASNSKGLTSINAGRKINLAQANIAQAELKPREVAAGLVGKHGTNETECTPECTVQIDGKAFKGVIVDNKGQPIAGLKDNPLPEGTVLVVKDVKSAPETLLLYVQPTDSPEGASNSEMGLAFVTAVLETFGAICVTTFCMGKEGEEGASLGQ